MVASRPERLQQLVSFARPFSTSHIGDDCSVLVMLEIRACLRRRKRDRKGDAKSFKRLPHEHVVIGFIIDPEETALPRLFLKSLFLLGLAHSSRNTTTVDGMVYRAIWRPCGSSCKCYHCYEIALVVEITRRKNC